MIFQPFNAEQVGGNSLSGAMVKYFYEYKSKYHLEKGTLRVILNIKSESIDFIIKAFLILMVILVGYVCRKKIFDRKGYVFNMEVSLVIVTMLMVSPLSRKAHFIAMIYPLTVLVYYYANKSFKNLPIIEKWMPCFLVIAFILVTGSSHGFVGRTLADYLEAYSTIFWGSFLIWITFVVILWKYPTMHAKDQKKMENIMRHSSGN